MKPARFCYHQAATLPHAIELLTALGDDARIIAGGQSLVPMMNFRLAQPGHLVDIARVPGLNEIELRDRQLHLGALVTHRQVERSDHAGLRTGFSVLRKAMPHIGHPPIRTQGTVGGSIAHGDPTAEWCLLAVLLDARIEITGPRGTRTQPATDFLLGHYMTAIEPGEIVTAIVFPNPAPDASLVEHSDRAGDFATMAVAVQLDLDADRRTVTSGAIAVAGAGPKPVRIDPAEALLGAGGSAGEHFFDEVAATVAEAIDPPDDHHASSTFRRALARSLTRRALDQAARPIDD